MSESSPLPLDGILVLDLTRMLPGAVLVRTLVDLGARVVKIEDPNGGDPLRSAPPLVGDVGAGFLTFFRGVESVALDLRQRDGAAAARALAARADVVLESFRPRTLARWELDPEALLAASPRLVVCSLPGFASRSAEAGRAVHDLNAAALSGFLEGLEPGGLPRVQLADVGTGLLGAASVLAALLLRERTGKGGVVEQPLVTGPLPFLTWTLAAASIGGAPADGRLFAGAPEYRRYRASDGVELAVAVLEPKLARALLEMLGLPSDFAADADALAGRFAQRPGAEWLALAREAGLPITRINTAASALVDPDLEPLLEDVSGTPLRAPGPFLPTWPRPRDLAPAPRLGEHTESVLAKFGVSLPKLGR
jgi:alpha-methylacyl-CoA racemase